MKKVLLIVLLGMLTLAWPSKSVIADDYHTYQEIVFDSDTAVLLKEYSSDNYETNYAKISQKAFMGWRVVLVHKEETVTFISETKLRIYNDGYSTIKHDIKLKSSEESRFQISASGSIGIEVKGDIKKFKGALDADIKASVEYAKTTTESEEYTFSITVDPGTYVRIVTRGEGIVNNGVAKQFFFWIQTKKGGWETFTVTTEYYEIIKERIG